MEFEALLLGLEPMTALAIGVGAVVLAPVVNAVGQTVKADPKAIDSLSESAREAAKECLGLGI